MQVVQKVKVGDSVVDPVKKKKHKHSLFFVKQTVLAGHVVITL